MLKYNLYNQIQYTKHCSVVIVQGIPVLNLVLALLYFILHSLKLSWNLSMFVSVLFDLLLPSDQNLNQNTAYIFYYLLYAL